jgi:hypothetical protein
MLSDFISQFALLEGAGNPQKMRAIRSLEQTLISNNVTLLAFAT